MQRIEAWLEASIVAHQTIGVETVLSTAKYRRLVTLAKSLSFRIQLVYVILDAPERNVERVAIRVTKGGHDVAKAKIIERYWRSLDQLPWFLAEADSAFVFDNSKAAPRLVARKDQGAYLVDPAAIEPIVAATEAARRSQAP